VQEFPEVVGWVRVGVARGGGGYAWVEADEDAEEVGDESVAEFGEVGVGCWRGVA